MKIFSRTMHEITESQFAPLIRVDGEIKDLAAGAVTATALDAYVASMSLNFVDIVRRPEFVISLVTEDERLWGELASSCSCPYWIARDGRGIAIYEPDTHCGATRAYQWVLPGGLYRKFSSPHPSRPDWKIVASEVDLLAILHGEGRPHVYRAWVNHQREVHTSASQLAEGRIANTTVEKSIIYSRGNGCAFCGDPAPAYVATTICDGRLFMQLQVCRKHQEEAMAAPTVLSALADLLHAKIDLPTLQRVDHVPDHMIAPIVAHLASGMGATAAIPEKRANGWFVKFQRSSGWEWRLRLRALDDYAYLLFDPQGEQRHRIDSAAHHPNLPFGPAHQHANPNSKKESLSPSFTYGVPLFDMVMLNETARRYEHEA